MRRLRRAAPLGLAAAALIPSLLLGGVVDTPAAAETLPVEVLIESVSPALPTVDDDLVLSGRIANTSEADVTLPQVQLRLSPLQLNSRGEITEVLDGTTDRTGLALPDTLTELGPTLAPGQQAQFRLSVPVEDLNLDPQLAGVYAVFVEALSGGVPLIEAGTVFPWFPPDAELRPTRLSWVWPIIQKPAVAADELVTDPALPAEFASSGRLGRLLDTGEQYPISWLIDTSTWQTADAMADGYRVPGADGPQPGDQTESAGQFAGRLRQIMADGVSTTPQFAMADADALQRGGLSQYVVRSASLPKVISDQIAPGAPTGALFDAPSGTIDPAALETLVDAGLRELLLSERFFPPDPPVAYTPSGITPITTAGTEVAGLLNDQQLGRVLQQPLDTAARRSRAKQGIPHPDRPDHVGATRRAPKCRGVPATPVGPPAGLARPPAACRGQGAVAATGGPVRGRRSPAGAPPEQWLRRPQRTPRTPTGLHRAHPVAR